MNSSIVRPIKLAGREVLHFLEEPAEFYESRRTLDVAELVRLLRLDSEEARFVRARLTGARLHELPELLRRTPEQCELMRARVKAKVGRRRYLLAKELTPLSGNSLKLAVNQQLPNGNRTWALTELTQEFSEIMARERKYIS